MKPLPLVRSMKIIAGAVMLALLAILGLQAWRAYQDDMNQAATTAGNLSGMLAEHAARTVDAVDLSLQRVAERIGAHGAMPEKDEASTLDYLRRIVEETKQLRALWIAAPDGQVLLLTHLERVPDINIANKRYFTTPRDNADAGLTIGRPEVGVVTGEWFIAMSRRIETPDGRFLGVAAAAVDNSYFSSFYDDIDIGPYGTLSFLSDDGVLLAKVGEGTNARIGRVWQGHAVLREALAAGDEGAASPPATVRIVDPDDGLERIYAYRRIDAHPLAIALGLAVRDVRAKWMEDRGPDLVLAIAFGAILFLLAIPARRLIVEPIAQVQSALQQFRNGDLSHPLAPSGGASEIRELNAGVETMRRSLDQLTQSLNAQVMERTEELSRRNALFDSALSSMAQGLAIFDSHQRLIVCNARYREMYDLPGELTVRGTPLAKIIEHNIEKRDTLSAAAKAQRIKARLDLAQRRSPGTMAETTASGHIVEIFHSPMTDGGSVATYKDVTEQRRIEEALRESERRYRLLAENASDLITRQTPDGTVLYVSPAVLTLLGFESDMMIGRRLIDYVHNNDRPRFERHQKALLTHGADRVTIRLRHAGGDYVWLETSARVVRDRSSGRIIELQSASRDVTERVEAERALAEKSTLLQATLDNMMQGLCLLDGELKVKLFNKRYLELLDLDESSAPLGKSLEQLLRHLTQKGEFGPVDNVEAEVQRRLRQTTRPIPTRWERTRPGGRVLDIQTCPFPNGGFVVTFTDITARKSAEQELAHQSRLLQTTFNSMEQGLMVVDRDMNLVVCNRRYRTLVDVPDDLVRPGTPVTELVRHLARQGEYGPAESEEQARELAEQWLDRIRNASRRDGVFEHERPNGMTLEIIRVPIPDGGVLSIYTDVTERRKAVQVMEEAHGRAVAAAQAKARFLATVSHEIRNPLTSIVNTVDFLLDTPLDDEQRHYGEIIRQSSDLLMDLLNDVLDLSKIDAGKVKLAHAEFDLGDLAVSVVDLLTPQATSKGIHLGALLSQGTPIDVAGDGRRLRQILVNLIGNAVKFTDEGRVELSVCEVESPPTAANRRKPKAAGEGEVAWLRFDVRDTGPGIPSDMQRNLFAEFSQGDQPVAHGRSGTGLGLAISKRIVELMGGRIDFTSTPGRGSHFWFEVPLDLQAHSRRLEHALVHTPTHRESNLRAFAPTASANNAHHGPAATPLVPVDGHNGETPRVLIAEDNAVNQFLVARALEDAGFTVDVVDNGKDAVLAAEETVYDVVVMDVQMPEMNGLDAARAVRMLDGANGRVPIIAMTANASPEASETCRAAGMDDHLPKPFRRRQLVEAVRRWLDHGDAVSSSTQRG